LKREMLCLKKLVDGRHCFLIGLVVLLCIRSSLASNYFAYIHGKEPKPTERPLSVFKTKLLRLCALYARGQRAQERLIALDMDGIAVGRRLDEPPQICRPVLIQMASAPRIEIPDAAPIVYAEEENQ